MNKKIILCVFIGLIFLKIGHCQQPQALKEVFIKTKPSEKWWVGIVNQGEKMPVSGIAYTEDFYANSQGNQFSPLLLSNEGRYIWSEKPFRFEFNKGEINISNQHDSVYVGLSGASLADAYRYASKNFFPPSGEMPDTTMFIQPQFNTWIELVYNQNQQDILKYAHDIVNNGFEPGVLMIDDNWQRYYGNFEFKAERFANPEKLVKELHQMGFKVMLWVCPFVSPDSKEFRELSSKKYFIMNPKPGSDKSWKSADEPAIIHWWNGYSAELDFTNQGSVKWFKSNLDSLKLKYGIDGFKFDAGDAQFYNDSFITYQKMSVNDQILQYGLIGEQYPLNEFRVMWKMGGQPLAQRLKDKSHNWEDLNKIIPHSFIESLIGNYFTCPDMIGGGEFTSFISARSYDEDLVVRSAQCQALMPMMQFSVAPWRILDKKRLDAVKACVALRKQFIPYILSLVKKAAVSGEPIITPMEFYFPNQGYADIKDQFMLGNKILVAPVLKKDADERTVILPKGKWKGDDGILYAGGKSYTIKTPVERLPYFELIQK
ncbi:MAG: glycoside hydrolase family 31 protein [Bacteroidetes bacterium]|nr:glycoside hydrolase family 31 protein [Bacteroidota bacterium]MCL6102874.1 glycoside hydrolase family 31 protein [Bacteroidota bacterium]